MLTLEVHERMAGEVVILDVHGRATIGPGADLLSATLRKVMDRGSRKVLVNLAQTQQLDSSSISILVRAFVTIGKNGGSLRLVGATGRVREVLHITRLLDAIPSYEHEAGAVASFG